MEWIDESSNWFHLHANDITIENCACFRFRWLKIGSNSIETIDAPNWVLLLCLAHALTNVNFATLTEWSTKQDWTLRVDGNGSKSTLIEFCRRLYRCVSIRLIRKLNAYDTLTVNEWMRRVDLNRWKTKCTSGSTRGKRIRFSAICARVNKTKTLWYALRGEGTLCIWTAIRIRN